MLALKHCAHNFFSNCANNFLCAFAFTKSFWNFQMVFSALVPIHRTEIFKNKVDSRPRIEFSAELACPPAKRPDYLHLGPSFMRNLDAIQVRPLVFFWAFASFLAAIAVPSAHLSSASGKARRAGLLNTYGVTLQTQAMSGPRSPATALAKSICGAAARVPKQPRGLVRSNCAGGRATNKGPSRPSKTITVSSCNTLISWR